MFPLKRTAQSASNCKGGTNPPFGLEEFKELYPHFWKKENSEESSKLEPIVPVEVMEMFIEFANATVKESRYHKAWKHCISLFIAHFLTLYMQSMVDPENADANSVINAGQIRGLQSSKSVDGVSVSYDFSSALQGLDGWASWTATLYGTQFATMAKMYGKGGMYVR